MRTLVIADLHNRVDWIDPFLDTIEYDRVVFLGDYFDDFGDGPNHAEHTAKWLRSALDNPKAIFLMGNHDMPYRFQSNQNVHCPGYSDIKGDMVRIHLKGEDWQKMGLIHWEQGWLLSHAGINRELFFPNKKQFKLKELQEICDQALSTVAVGGENRIFNAGWSRMGSQKHGGITWQCWKEFAPIEGWNQIVGHTPSGHVRKKYLIKRGLKKKVVIDEPIEGDEILSSNHCIDTNSMHYAIIEDGKVSIHATPSLNKFTEDPEYVCGIPIHVNAGVRFCYLHHIKFVFGESKAVAFQEWSKQRAASKLPAAICFYDSVSIADPDELQLWVDTQKPFVENDLRDVKVPDPCTGDSIFGVPVYGAKNYNYCLERDIGKTLGALAFEKFSAWMYGQTCPYLGNPVLEAVYAHDFERWASRNFRPKI